MTTSIGKFTKSFFIKVFVGIIILPFVFWGMGDVFRGGNQNVIASVDSKKISTQEFINYINRLNLSDEQVKKVTAEILKKQRVDILVNNAGIIKRIPALEMSPDDFRAVTDVHLTGSFHLAQQFATSMVSRKSGKIINICSMMSELGRNTVSAYAAAKGGLKMLTRNLATEWAKYNIQVNGIGPGYFETSQTAPIRVDGHPFNDFIINRTPAGRWGKTEDLKGTAVFLASKASDFVNGQIIYVDGGILATIGKPNNE